MNDHDLLVSLDTKVTMLSTNVINMNENASKRLENHEGRIRTIENEHLRYNAAHQIQRIDDLENKVGRFWSVVGVASGIGAAVGITGGYVIQILGG